MMLNFTALTDDRLLLSPFDPPSAGPSSNGSESCFQKILLSLQQHKDTIKATELSVSLFGWPAEGLPGVRRKSFSFHVCRTSKGRLRPKARLLFGILISRASIREKDF